MSRHSYLTAITPIPTHINFVEARALMSVVRKTEATLKWLKALSFINFARWSVVEKFPGGVDPVHIHMIFETNFNGPWEQYIDAFAEVMTWNFKLFWGRSKNFPGTKVTGPFKDWVARHQFEIDHVYCAYPTGSATIVKSALRLAPAVEELRRDAETLSPEDFERRFDLLLTEHQLDF